MDRTIEVRARGGDVQHLNAVQLKKLYEEYSRIVRLEVGEFGCKPTSITHLIGRMGEFFCALQVKGSLAHVTNQHGFDVIGAYGRKISVKTTAQVFGFVPVNPKTLEQVDDLMILQFDRNELKLNVIYFGEVRAALKQARPPTESSRGKYELDISKAKKLQAGQDRNRI